MADMTVCDTRICHEPQRGELAGSASAWIAKLMHMVVKVTPHFWAPHLCGACAAQLYRWNFIIAILAGRGQVTCPAVTPTAPVFHA